MKNFTYDDFNALFSQTSDDVSDLYNSLEENIKFVPVIKVDKLEDIPEPEDIEQIYRLSEFPPVEVISGLSENYNKGKSEVGIVGIKGCLLMVIPILRSRNAIALPHALDPISRKNLFQLDFHSHAINIVLDGLDGYEAEYTTDWPGDISPEDLTFLDNTINRKLGVGEFSGLISLTVPSKPLNQDIMYDEFYLYSIDQQLEILGNTLNDYKKSINMNHIDPKSHPMESLYIRRGFLKEYFEYRLIPWENEAEIAQWFQDQMNLTL